MQIVPCHSHCSTRCDAERVQKSGELRIWRLCKLCVPDQRHLHAAPLKACKVYGWPNGFAFILSFLAPLWSIGMFASLTQIDMHAEHPPAGAFDSSVHISEEATNASVAVPWAMMGACGIAGVLGWGEVFCVILVAIASLTHNPIAINVALAFCMGSDIEGIMSNTIGQPMATVCLFRAPE